MIEQIERSLIAFAKQQKIPYPFWTEIFLEEKEDKVEATVIVSIELLPSPMFLDNVSLAVTLQELISNPFVRLEDGTEVFVYFAIPENIEETEEGIIKKGQNEENLPPTFVGEVHSQALQKLGSLSQLAGEAAIAYWAAMGAWEVIERSLKPYVEREEIDGIVVYHSK